MDRLATGESAQIAVPPASAEPPAIPAAWNNTPAECSQKPMHRLFETCARRIPAAVRDGFR
jgi:hypothetical protein